MFTKVDGARRRFTRVFTRQRQPRIAMVEVSEPAAALQAARAALAGNMAGVFLCNDSIGHQSLLEIARTVVAAHPAAFVGVHCRDLRPQDVIHRLPDGIDGVWAEPGESGTAAGALAIAVQAARDGCDWDGLVFGNTPSDEHTSRGGDPLEIERVGHIDVVCVNGPGKDGPPRIDHIHQLRAALAPRPMAVVCGQTLKVWVGDLSEVDCLLIPVRERQEVAETHTADDSSSVHPVSHERHE